MQDLEAVVRCWLTVGKDRWQALQHHYSALHAFASKALTWAKPSRAQARGLQIFEPFTSLD